MKKEKLLMPAGGVCHFVPTEQKKKEKKGKLGKLTKN